MNHPIIQGPSEWPIVASKLGFEFDPSSNTASRNGWLLRPEGNWFSLEERAAFAGDPILELIGTAGLWRGMREQVSDEPRRVFDLPPVLGVSQFDDEPEPYTTGVDQPGSRPLALRELIEWADLTAKGSPPAGWTTPSLDEIEQWMTLAQLHARAGAHVAEGGLVCEAGRLAFVMPSLARISTGLSPARIAWLNELCHCAQENWRMVRFGFDAASSCVAAEVDLTGAPASCLPSLMEIAQSALLNAATWALPALALAADPSIESLMLDRNPKRPIHPSPQDRQAR